jgi:hypothetical protein
MTVNAEQALTDLLFGSSTTMAARSTSKIDTGAFRGIRITFSAALARSVTWAGPAGAQERDKW